jgi:RNA polymerase nonessential primary-like sigma factor
LTADYSHIDADCHQLEVAELRLWRRLLSPPFRTLTCHVLPGDIRRELGKVDLREADNWRRWLRAAVARSESTWLAGELRAVQAIRNRVVIANMGLVWGRAQKYVGRRLAHEGTAIELEDLTQQGVLGLVRATEAFKPSLGYKFSTYACWWIKHALDRYVMNLALPVRLPVHLHRRMQVLNAVQADLATSMGRPPTEEELVDVAVLRGRGQGLDEHLSADSQKALAQTRWARQVLVANISTVRLDEPPPGGSDTTTHHEALADMQQQRRHAAEEAKQDLRVVFRRLNGQRLSQGACAMNAAELLAARAGGASLLSIGTEWGVSRERIRQLEQRALEHARDVLGIKPEERLSVAGLTRGGG